jgi:hypothetical protein
VSAYVLDEQNSGDIVVPASLGEFPKTIGTIEGRGSGGSNRFCAELGADNPACDTIDVSLTAEAKLPPTYGFHRYLTLSVQIPGPPPRSTLTLPSPDVDAIFVLTEGAVYEQFAVTGGSVTVHIEKGELVVDLEAVAMTSDGETISLHDGRYALTNGRYEEICQLD